MDSRFYGMNKQSSNYSSLAYIVRAHVDACFASMWQHIDADDRLKTTFDLLTLSSGGLGFSLYGDSVMHGYRLENGEDNKHPHSGSKSRGDGSNVTAMTVDWRPSTTAEDTDCAADGEKDSLCSFISTFFLLKFQQGSQSVHLLPSSFL